MSKIFAVGDVHGRFDLLKKAFDAIGPLDADKRIVMLGDYVDRGAESAECIDFLIAAQASNTEAQELVCLMGNHERMMLDALINGSNYGYMSSWLMNGGIETLESYGAAIPGGIVTSDPLRYIPTEHVDWLNGLPLSYETDNLFFVHAGVNPDRPLNDQKEKDLLWIREYFLKTDRGSAQEKHIVHGHTPHPHDNARFAHAHRRTNLDSGAVWTNILTIGIFDTDIEGGPIGYIFLEGTHEEITTREYFLNVKAK